jgi:hypothetical protein
MRRQQEVYARTELTRCATSDNSRQRVLLAHWLFSGGSQHPLPLRPRADRKAPLESGAVHAMRVNLLSTLRFLHLPNSHSQRAAYYH